MNINFWIFSFSIQVFLHFLLPALSLEFFLSLPGILVFLFLLFMFKQYFIEIIKEVKVEE